MPRRFWNQCEISAISGPKEAEEPEKPDQQAVGERELQDAGRETGEDITERKRTSATHERKDDAEPVRDPAHQDAAEGEAHHGQRIGEGGARALHAELLLKRRGSATTTDHIPTPPMALRATAIPSRIQARRESIWESS